MAASGEHDSIAIAGELLAWYDRHARALPWRAPPGSPLPVNDQNWPYRVWLAEVMLQQTTVAAVRPYFESFIRRWPSVTMLAKADAGEVMAAWAGLGYYARARNLLACAQAVTASGGQFPATEAGLRALPGLGAYTAAAVAAIAFGLRAVVVDANVERVVARLFAIAGPLPAARRAIRNAADRITPNARPGDFAQAMMDLGAMVCTARAPRCAACPLARHCRARVSGEMARFPVRAVKKPKPERQGQAYWITRGDAVWLERRPAQGLLGGMLALPDDYWSARSDGNEVPPLAGQWTPLGSVRHTFTHFHLTMQVLLYLGADLDMLEPCNGQWWPNARLTNAGLPSLFVKAARLGAIGGEND